MRPSIALASCSLLVLPTAALAADMQPGQWEVTAQMQMEGMSIPPNTTRFCMRKEDTGKPPMQMDNSCKMLDQKRSGDTMSFRMQCNTPGQGATTMSMTITSTTTAYSGSGEMDMGGEKMKMRYSGKRIGDCK